MLLFSEGRSFCNVVKINVSSGVNIEAALLFHSERSASYNAVTDFCK